MIRIQYFIQTGRKLNIEHPKRFTEKIQQYKLYYRNSLMLQCTDKCEVRKYVESKGLSDILIPVVGVYGNVKDIDMDSLPNEFVAKTTDGGGGCQVYICRDKTLLESASFLKTISQWMNMSKLKPFGREWAYENDYPRRIIIEELIKDGVNFDLTDYKFFCFSGRPHFCQVITNRSFNESIDFFDMEWRHLPFRGLNPRPQNAKQTLPMPSHFERMKDIAHKLSQPFPFARIDLYSTNKQVYFSEITFYPASGYGCFTPDEWDFKFGDLLQMPC